MNTKDYISAQEIKKAGYVRATNTAPVLRAYGFNVVMVRIRSTYHSGGTKYRTRLVPWAPGWAVGLVKRMRRLGLRSEVRKQVMEEALRLGKPGPLADAAVVAGRMMR